MTEMMDMEIEEKDERTVEMEARMYLPIEWSTTAPCKIQDLKEPQYDEVLRLIKHHHFKKDPMCKAAELLHDKLSVTRYLELVRILLQDTTSIVALSLVSGRVVGVVVTRINSLAEKTDTYDRVQVLQGKVLKKIMHLKHTLVKQTDAHSHFGHDSYLRIYVLCVHPTYEDRDVADAIMHCASDVARSLDMPAIGGIFTSGQTQTIASNLGYRIFSEIRYSQWVVNEEVVFDDPGKGNYSAAFMGMILPHATIKINNV